MEELLVGVVRQVRVQPDLQPPVSITNSNGFGHRRRRANGCQQRVYPVKQCHHAPHIVGRRWSGSCQIDAVATRQVPCAGNNDPGRLLGRDTSWGVGERKEENRNVYVTNTELIRQPTDQQALRHAGSAQRQHAGEAGIVAFHRNEAPLPRTLAGDVPALLLREVHANDPDHHQARSTTSRQFPLCDMEVSDFDRSTIAPNLHTAANELHCNCFQ